MVKKLSLFLVSVLAASSMQAQSDYDVSLKYGITSLDNDDGLEFKNHSLGLDVAWDLGYGIKPRIDFNYINVNDSDKWGGVSSLIQGVINGQYGTSFSALPFSHELYMFGGLGYEYVVDGHDTFDSLPFFQGGVGAKYGVSDSLNILTEFRAMQVFDGNNDSDDEDHEFTLFLGVNFPFGGVPKMPMVQEMVPAPAAAAVVVEPQAVTVLDSDHDGVEDSMDDCPGTRMTENMTVNEKGCEVIILKDSDNDGVTDDLDACPNTPEGAEIDISGCAQALNLHINFESGSDVIKEDSMIKVQEFATYLKSAPDGTIAAIEGYTDSTGDAKKNQALSSKRAFAVRRALIATGVKKNMVRAYGKGSTNPIDTNDTPEGRAQNRRIEAVITH